MFDLPGYPTTSLTKTLDELLSRDRQREQDGFPRRIQIGKMVKPGRAGRGKMVIVPTTVEEKFYHDPTVRPPDEDPEFGGTGKEEEGEVIGEQRVRPEEEGAGAGHGGREEGAHDVDSTAYDLGRTLSGVFELPNLREKGKKRAFTRYTYDLSDINRGTGQILDKKATLRRIIQTNIALGNLPDPGEIDTSRFLIPPRDRVYRVFSEEKDYQPQAILFFVRDYSGSMQGAATDLVVTQHVFIYSWLLYQYAGQVDVRFILHDIDAKEVPDFHIYYNSTVAGGTLVSSAYKLVNEIVAAENLADDYNIYVFQGTDGDDWDTSGDKALPELKRMLGYASRVGITIVAHGDEGTDVSSYLEASGMLEQHRDLLKMDMMGEDADESRLIEGIKKLIS